MRKAYQVEGVACDCDATVPKTATGIVTWRTPQEKARWLDEAAQADARLPLTRAIAVRIARTIDPNRKDLLVEEIHRFVRDSIHYVHDPSFEEFASSDVTLQRGVGDCDDKARLFVALARSVGVEAPIWPDYNKAGDFVHVQAVARWPGSSSYRLAKPGGWVLGEFIVRGAKLGDDFPQFPRDAAGRIPLV